MNYTSYDANLFYTTLGEGPDLVLLHPTPCDHRFWLAAAGPLSAHYRVILPDLRGHGQSEAGKGPITVEKLGADVEHLLDELQIDRALFAGCSIGGYTLFELWRKSPSRVLAMAFCCAKPQADTEATRIKREGWIAKIRERGTSGFVSEMVDALIGPTARRRAPEKVVEIREMMEAVSPEALIAVQQGLALRPDSVETAKAIRVPCFVLAGGEDTTSTPAELKGLVELIRSGGYGAEYAELRDAGHYAPWEQPEMTARLLRRFFESVMN